MRLDEQSAQHASRSFSFSGTCEVADRVSVWSVRAQLSNYFNYPN